MFQDIRKKQIILVRHAKAVEREDWEGKDFDRPLTSFGENANKIVANYLRLIGVRPDCIVASPSMRTRGTAVDIAKKFNIENIEFDPELYNGNPKYDRDAMEVHMNVVHRNKKDGNILMIVGHNSDLSLFAGYLSGDGIPSMKKGSVIVLSIPGNMEWKDIKPGSLKFVYYITPHFLRLEDLV